jgi:hypothetical protein
MHRVSSARGRGCPLCPGVLGKTGAGAIDLNRAASTGHWMGLILGRWIVTMQPRLEQAVTVRVHPCVP